MGIGKFIKDAISGASGGILKGASEIIGQFVTDPDKKLEAEIKLKELGQAHEARMAEIDLKVQELEQKSQEELTKRHANDMLSDSWLSKNIRPMTLIFLLLMLLVLVILDSAGINFDVAEMYVDLLKVLLVSVFLFYFGGREMTKIVTAWKKK